MYQSDKYSILFILPVQVCPLPLNPVLHAHPYEPTVSVHVAFWSQSWVWPEHSSISTHIIVISFRKKIIYSYLYRNIHCQYNHYDSCMYSYRLYQNRMHHRDICLVQLCIHWYLKEIYNDFYLTVTRKFMRLKFLLSKYYIWTIKKNWLII